MDKLKTWIQGNIQKMDVDEPNDAIWDRVKIALTKPLEIDPCKKHISENKNKLEIETPDPKSWQEISGLISPKKTGPSRYIKTRLIYLSAACIILIISLGIFRYMNVRQMEPTIDVVKKPQLKNHVQPESTKNETTNTESSIHNQTVTLSIPASSRKQTVKNKTVAVASSKPLKKQKRELLPPVIIQINKDYDQLIASQIAYTKSLPVYGESAGYFAEFMNDFKTLENQEKALRKSIVENGLQENNINELATIYQQKLTVLKKLQNEINKTSSRNKNLTDTIPAYISL